MNEDIARQWDASLRAECHRLAYELWGLADALTDAMPLGALRRIRVKRRINDRLAELDAERDAAIRELTETSAVGVRARIEYVDASGNEHVCSAEAWGAALIATDPYDPGDA